MIYFVRNKYLTLLSILLPLLFSNCSTEKNTGLSRTYHNINSKFNIFFNGQESYKSGVLKAEKNFTDNYSKILPVFYYSNETVAQTVAPEMNRALQKASKVITLHSITAKPEFKKGPQTQKQRDFYNQKEYNKWIKNNLLLMGKAYTYKRDFFLAQEALRKLITDYPNEPLRYEALIWMARANSEQEEYREAERILILLETDTELPKSLKGDLYITLADLYIKQNNYPKAIPYLEKALEFTRKKTLKLRYSYILAQLYEETGEPDKANKKYREVIKMNPPYEMTFNAKINMAGTFTPGGENAREISAQLRKMLKDDKNIEFLDQVYYALGDLEFKQGNEENAIDFFKLSAEKSVSNFNQKGLTYITLGDIYYKNKDYPLAQAYYDSSLLNITIDYENYEELSKKTASLTGLVENIQIYELEDSVQRLAKLPEQERFVIIDKIISDLIASEEEERRKMQDEQLDMQQGNIMASQSSNRAGTETAGGKWYFYNLNAKSFGQPEFRMKWGNRRLEDNWRRKNKQTVETFEERETETQANGEQTSERVINNKSREFYLVNIPLNDSMKTASDEKLAEALFNLGVIYRNEFNDIAKSIESFEELIQRYPVNQFELTSYYNLYELYAQINQPDKSEMYKNLLVGKFPDSPTARILTDPNYLKQLEESRNKEYSFYDETYEALNRSEFNRVITNANLALNTFKNKELYPRFRLLSALANGGLSGKEVLKTEMEKLAEDYPDHEVGKYANEMVNFIYQEAPEIKIADTFSEAVEIYSFNPDTVHYLAVLTDKSTNNNQLNFNIINFNLDNYSNLNLAIQRETINENTLFIISSFDNIDLATRYMSSFMTNPDAFRDIDLSLVKVFLISGDNFNTLLSDKDAGKYLLFYEKYYPRN
jgi:tetratricopeptide (TPR) repeat protein